MDLAIVLIACMILSAVVDFGINQIFYKKRYNEGFTVGVLMTMLWVQGNTKADDVFYIYDTVVKEHPEDGIYIGRIEGGSIKFSKKAKLVKFEPME